MITRNAINNYNPATINNQTNTTYQLASGDEGAIITLTNSSAITVTVPANSTTAFSIGTTVWLQQGGSGTVSISPAGGVTVNSEGSLTDLNGQYAIGYLMKTDTDEWVFWGDRT